MSSNPLNKIKEHIAAISISCILFAEGLQFLWIKFTHFGYYDWDLALYANTMWTMLHGSLIPSLFDIPFLGNHSQYIAFLLLPIYCVFPHPFTLVVLKILAFTLSGYILYLIAASKLSKGWGIFFLLLFWAYPANLFMLTYEFHFENLALLPLMLSFYFLLNDRFKGYLIAVVLTSLIKENMALVVVFLGLYALLYKKKNLKWSAWPILIGLTVFLISVLLVIPHSRNVAGLNANQYAGYYSQILSAGHSPIEKISAVLHNKGNQSYLMEVFTPLNILPFINPAALIGAIPLFLQHLLSTSDTMKLPFYHYMASLAPFLFIAAIDGLRFIQIQTSKRIFIFLVFLTTLTTGLSIQKHIPSFYIRFYDFIKSDSLLNREFLKSAMDKDNIVASFQFLAPLANRNHIISAHHVWENINHFSHRKPDLDSLEYALINWEDAWLSAAILYENPETVRKYLQNFSNFYLTYDWETINAANHTVLLRKTSTPNVEKLVKRIQASDLSQIPKESRLNINLNGEIILKGFQVEKKAAIANPATLIRLYWESVSAPSQNYQILMGVEKNETGDKPFEFSRHIGYFIYPTSHWKPGEYYEENLYLALPELEQGQYHVYMAFLDQKFRPIKFIQNGSEGLDILYLFDIKIDKSRR